MSRWFRWYEGTTEDGKFRVVARKSRVTVRDVIALWAFILEDAANLAHRGVCNRDEDFMSSVLDFEDGVVEAILSAMDDVGMISVGMGAITICNFSKRQFDSDVDPTAADRQRRKRERDKQVSNAPVTRDSRPPEAETEKIEKETPNGVSKKQRGTRIPEDFSPDLDWAVAQGLSKRDAESQAQRFRDYWRGKAGAAGVKLDWPATWRNWVRSHLDRAGIQPPAPLSLDPAKWQSRLRLARDRRSWSTVEWGPRPREPGCLVPVELLLPDDGNGWSEWKSE